MMDFGFLWGFQAEDATSVAQLPLTPGYVEAVREQAERDSELARIRVQRPTPPSHAGTPLEYEPLRGVFDLRARNSRGRPVRIFDGWE
jgi:hypothetical protein